MNLFFRFLLPAVILPAVVMAADVDPAKERARIEREYTRDTQKVDQAREQAMIPVNSKRRELAAKIERENSTVLNLSTYLLTNGTSGVDFDKIQQIRFDQLEGTNLIDRQMIADVDDKTQEKRDEFERRRTLDLARLDAQAITEGEEAAKQRAAAIKRAEITAKWQEKIDALNREGHRAEAKLSLDKHTELNRLDAEIYVTEQKALFEALKKMQADAKSGKDAGAAYASALQPVNQATQALKEKRDTLSNEIETALEQLRAKFNAQRTDLENGRDDDLAKIET
jgi:hypothetical protein